jgi:hypothetical protein
MSLLTTDKDQLSVDVPRSKSILTWVSGAFKVLELNRIVVIVPL